MTDTVAHQLGAEVDSTETRSTSGPEGRLTELPLSVFIVASFGALGGVLAYYAKVVDGKPLGGALWTAALLGAGAGFAGVFLFIKGASVRDAKTLAIALAFGMTWKPVMAAIESWSAAQLNERDATLVHEAAQKLKVATDRYLEVPALTKRRLEAEPGAGEPTRDADIQQLRAQAVEVSNQLDAVLRR